MRTVFRNMFERRGQISDVVTFSWKRPGVEYSVEWLYWYKLASRCLSSSESMFFEAAKQLDTENIRALDFSQFEELLSFCQ